MIKHQPKALEMLLVKEAGYNLSEIRGEREVHTITEEPQGLVAALGRVTPRAVRMAMAAAVALGMLGAYETGMASPLVVSLILAVALHWVGELDAEASQITHEVQKPGMKRREVYARAIQHDEHEQMKEEKREEAQRKAKTQANAQGVK